MPHNSTMRDAITACAAIAAYVALMVITNTIAHNTIVALTCTNLIALACVFMWRKRHKTEPLIAKRRISLLFYISTILILIIVNMGSTTIALWIKQLTNAPSPIQNLMATTPLATIIAASLIAAPLGEESLLRGFVYPMLRKHLSAPFTIAITACLFALLHGNLVQIVLTLPLGIVLGYLYERTHDLRLCIGVHMLFNVMTVVLPSPTVSAGNAGATLLLMVAALTMWMDTDVKKL